MAVIKVTKQCMDSILAAGGRPVAALVGTMWQIEISHDQYEALKLARQPGEDVSDVVMRWLAEPEGLNPPVTIPDRSTGADA